MFSQASVTLFTICLMATRSLLTLVIARSVLILPECFLVHTMLQYQRQLVSKLKWVVERFKSINAGAWCEHDLRVTLVIQKEDCFRHQDIRQKDVNNVNIMNLS